MGVSLRRTDWKSVPRPGDAAPAEPLKFSPRTVDDTDQGCVRMRARRGKWHTMYESHFGLRRRPFPATPDSECYYPATGHERALALLQQALANEEGLALLTGEPGTGKTLLGHRLLEGLGADATCAFLTNSHFRDPAGLLQAILYDLTLPYEGHGEQELRLALTDHLLRTY